MSDSRPAPPYRLTGVRLLPASWAKRLGMWSAHDQRRCTHPDQHVRLISGDERNYGYLWQCMACGLFVAEKRSLPSAQQGAATPPAEYAYADEAWESSGSALLDELSPQPPAPQRPEVDHA